MSAKKKYILYLILDLLFSILIPVVIVLYNYVTPTASTGYKISLTGIVLFILIITICKSVFENSYRDKLDTFLQQLAEATDLDVKQAISDKINALKVRESIYARIMLLLPFAVILFVSTVAIKWLETLRATVGLIFVTVAVGSIFNVLKKPLKDKVAIEKIKAEVAKKKNK